MTEFGNVHANGARQNGASFSITLPHRESTTIAVRLIPDEAFEDGSFAAQFAKMTTSYHDWIGSCT